MSVHGGIGGRGFEHLLGVCGGLLPPWNDSFFREGTTLSLSVGLVVLASTGQGFFGSDLCEPGLCLSPASEGKK